MKIAVTGATGRLGRHVVDVLEAQGHDVVSIARSTGVDVITRQGLAEALTGVDTIIDAATQPSPDQDAATAFVTAAARNIQEAGERAGLSSHSSCAPAPPPWMNRICRVTDGNAQSMSRFRSITRSRRPKTWIDASTRALTRARGRCARRPHYVRTSLPAVNAVVQALLEPRFGRFVSRP